MKKSYSLYFAVALAGISFLYGSCKKPVHYPNPTPVNVRLMGLTKTTTNTIAVAIPGYSPAAQEVESYSFSYDANNRLSQVLYSNNLATDVVGGTANQVITFTYSSDTIYKTVTAVQTTIPIEKDTFIVNGAGQVITTFMPGVIRNYQYYGKLITGISETYYGVPNSGVPVSPLGPFGVALTTNSTFTSNNGDLLAQQHAATIDASFIPAVIPPLLIKWIFLAGTVDTVTHSPVKASTDVITDNSIYPVVVYAADSFGNYVWGYYPGNYGTDNYHIYDQLADRTGDYLQIESFILYGVNLYQTNHLVKSIANNRYTTTAAYTIDGDSKITEADVNILDVTSNNTNIVYRYTYANP
jgi:hypothetical protein